MIKNIVFDIGNIILEGTPSSSLNKIALDDNSKEIIKKTVFSDKLNELDYGYLSFDEYYNSIENTIPDELKEIGKYILNNSYYYRKFNKDIIKLIINLYHNNYKIYVLSDNNLETYNYLKNSSLNNYISGFCISSNFHETKKDGRLFDIFFEKFNINPSECYFIDDKKENINAGISRGMEGFTLDWINNNFDKLLNDLKEHEILK